MSDRINRSDRHAELCKQLARVLIPAIRWRADQLGYAIGVHGSLAFDIDVIAVPWKPSAVAPRELAEALRLVAESVNGTARADRDETTDPEHIDNGRPGEKPHGRLGWVFHLGGGPYIDLSVMPRNESTSSGPSQSVSASGSADRTDRGYSG